MRLGIVVAVVLAPAVALACGNSVHRVRLGNKEVARAEQLLEQGKNQDALDVVESNDWRFRIIGGDYALHHRLVIVREVAELRIAAQTRKQYDFQAAAARLHDLMERGKEDPML